MKKKKKPGVLFFCETTFFSIISDTLEQSRPKCNSLVCLVQKQVHAQKKDTRFNDWSLVASPSHSPPSLLLLHCARAPSLDGRKKYAVSLGVRVLACVVPALLGSRSACIVVFRLGLKIIFSHWFTLNLCASKCEVT